MRDQTAPVAQFDPATADLKGFRANPLASRIDTRKDRWPVQKPVKTFQVFFENTIRREPGEYHIDIIIIS
jgi:hypothetical protein